MHVGTRHRLTMRCCAEWRHCQLSIRSLKRRTRCLGYAGRLTPWRHEQRRTPCRCWARPPLCSSGHVLGVWSFRWFLAVLLLLPHMHASLTSGSSPELFTRFQTPCEEESVEDIYTRLDGPGSGAAVLGDRMASEVVKMTVKWRRNV